MEGIDCDNLAMRQWSASVQVLRTCKSAFIAHKILLVIDGEVLVQNTIQTACLVLVPIHAIFDMLGSITREVVCDTC
jgi:hypothetical protein